jgi:predicted  nucleic acid-binding Zn-ribbon protein
MHPQLKHLVELQAVDLRLIEIEERIGKIPKHLAEVEGRVTTARHQIAVEKESLTKSLKERKTYEMDVEQWKERATKYRNQSGEVKTNEAYKALLHEIENAEKEMAKAEDRLLERMVAGEEFDRRLKAAETAVKQVEASADIERRAIQAEYNATKKELAAAEALRAQVVATIPEDLVDNYQRIAKRHNGIGLAEIRGEGCGQCGVHIRPHVIQQLQNTETDIFLHCETCTRILYYPDPTAPKLGEASVPAVVRTAESPAAPVRES